MKKTKKVKVTERELRVLEYLRDNESFLLHSLRIAVDRAIFHSKVAPTEVELDELFAVKEFTDVLAPH